jgi:hypothetical protein
MAYTAPSGPLPVGGVVDDALRLYRSIFSRAWILAFAFSLALAGFSLVVMLNVPLDGTPGTQSLQQMLSALRSPPILTMYLLVTLLTFALYGSLMALANAVAHANTSFTLLQACATGFRRLPAIVLASLIFGVAVVLGLIVLIVPGIWLWGRLQLWIAAMFAEDATALGSLRSSWQITEGNWWRGSTIFSVAVILIFVVSFVFSLVGGVVAAILRLSLTDTQIVVQLFSLVANTITYPFFVATWLCMHRDFKLRREGGDLAARTRALGSA